MSYLTSRKAANSDTFVYLHHTPAQWCLHPNPNSSRYVTICTMLDGIQGFNGLSQAKDELITSLGSFLKENPEYHKALEVVQIPERVIQFRVLWEDDKGAPHVNTGYRVQVHRNSACPLYTVLNHLPILVQLRIRSLQRRSSPPPFRQPLHPQISRL